MSIPPVVALVLEALLGLFGAYAAYTLFAWAPASVVKLREPLRYPRWYWVLAGFVAAIGAIGLLVGLALPEVAAAAALWMIAYFVVAALSHLIRKDFVHLGAPLVFLALFVGLALLRGTDVSHLLGRIGL